MGRTRGGTGRPPNVRRRAGRSHGAGSHGTGGREEGPPVGSHGAGGREEGPPAVRGVARRARRAGLSYGARGGRRIGGGGRPRLARGGGQGGRGGGPASRPRFPLGSGGWHEQPPARGFRQRVEVDRSEVGRGFRPPPARGGGGQGGRRGGPCGRNLGRAGAGVRAFGSRTALKSNNFKNS